ncbi:MAG: mechanosensitive ion channel family protein [Actinomycetia bacterium]|nr:mechanosensitive ion channel family protein [Actinomycetes bacterium]
MIVAAPDWFADEYLGVEVGQYIGIGVLMVIATVAHFALLRVVALVVRRRFAGDDLTFWEAERHLLNRGIFLLAIGVTLLVGFPTLGFDPKVENVVHQASSLIAAAAVILIAYRAIDILVDVLARRATETETKLDDSLVPLLRTSMRLFVIVVGILFVLQNLDINVASLFAGLGLGGLAIALAAQDTVRNVLGGVTIFADKPFEVGDWVVVDGIEGTVETVGFRSTRVRTFYNSLVSVPNGNLMDAGIDNMGKRRWRRYKTTLGVGYHTTPDQMQAFVEGIRALIQAGPGMRQDYYIVEFHGFGATSLDVLVYCFIDAADWNEELRTRHVFNLDIMRLAESLQVDFAFPTQTLHIAEMPGQPQQLPQVPDRSQLRQVVNSFGPGGESGQHVDQPITIDHESVLESPYAQADEGG